MYSLKAQGVHAKISVSVRAPVVMFPVGDTIKSGQEYSHQAFMVDLGQVQIDNQVMSLGGNVAVESYGINLSQFKASRYGQCS